MKFVWIFSLAFAISSVVLGCKPSQKTVASANVMVIELGDSLDGKYLLKQYLEYNPSNVKPSNKTLNQYRVQFFINADNMSKLIRDLSEDKNIINMSNITATKKEVSTSTNNESSKVSIKKK